MEVLSLNCGKDLLRFLGLWAKFNYERPLFCEGLEPGRSIHLIKGGGKHVDF